MVRPQNEGSTGESAFAAMVRMDCLLDRRHCLGRYQGITKGCMISTKRFALRYDSAACQA
jgi:hypothetical protein